MIPRRRAKLLTTFNRRLALLENYSFPFNCHHRRVAAPLLHACDVVMTLAAEGTALELLDLPDALLQQLAALLEPRDRLVFASSSKTLFMLCWQSPHCWRRLAFPGPSKMTNWCVVFCLHHWKSAVRHLDLSSVGGSFPCSDLLSARAPLPPPRPERVTRLAFPRCVC